MTVFKDDAERRKCTMDLLTKGFTIVKLGLNKNIADAADELQAACPAADIHYVFAGDDLYLDAKWWRLDDPNWSNFVTDRVHRQWLTPDKSGVQRAKKQDG
jgi:hypothetical protein